MQEEASVAAPEIVVVWLVAAELSSPGAAALSGAAREVLGAATDVRVQAEPTVPVPTSALDPNMAVVHVTWDPVEHRSAHVVCYTPDVRGRVEHDVMFAASDPEPERGRALGFLIASILMDAREPAEPRRASQRSAPPAPARVDAGLGQGSASVAAPKTSLGAGAEAVGPGASTGFGAWLGVERALGARSLWVGAGVRARFGAIPPAQATTRFLSLGATGTWLALRPSESSWLGIKGGLFVSRLTISHLSDDDVEADEQSRWLPGAELALHGGLDFTPAAGLVADAGVELLAGETELSVRHRVVAVWSRTAGLLRLGVRTRF